MELQFNKNMNLISYKKYSTEIKKRDNKPNRFMGMRLSAVNLIHRKCSTGLELIPIFQIVKKDNKEY